MTGRTHELVALTSIIYLASTQTVPPMTSATAIVALGATCLGGLAPDLDKATTDFWDRMPAGSIIGKVIAPIIGGHRFLSHSLLGVLIFGILSRVFLSSISQILIVDTNIVWWAFMIGYVSHLGADMATREGVPWLFPIPFGFGIPPLKFFRIRTGGLLETRLIFPGLLVFLIYLISTSFSQFIAIFAK